jgi:hypothetical protein
MEWPFDVIGPEPKIYAVGNVERHLRLAIQTCSPAIQSCTIFRHTGWRQIGDKWHFLHAGGAITADGLCDSVFVELPGGLSSYRLPASLTDPAHRHDAFHASLTLRSLAPDHAMIPVLGAVYVAPLRELLGDHPPDFVGWLAGPSGLFKTEFATLGLQHFGAAFTSRKVSANFTATANALERLGHAAKDVFLLIDDFFPANDPGTRNALTLTAHRLLRSIGNQVGRPRMHSDTTMRADLPPRCIAFVTGENVPDSLSANARLLLQYITQATDLPALKQALSAAQDAKTLYSRHYRASIMASATPFWCCATPKHLTAKSGMISKP